MKTTIVREKDIKRDWYIVDATGKTLGRFASKIAHILMGKHKPSFVKHLDLGDYVIVINVDKMVLTGKKLSTKKYYHHSGYPGGLKEIVYEELMKEKPGFVLKKAVKGMLPKNKLARKMLKKLKVYSGSKHPHQAQKPKIIEI
ncbi:MAG: 50S ribosomal protein L13 [Actinomycetia bacterium]|nr:50S ribosomal protein L13 [Actinomycetes bacterium]